jgi:hypothetical protein
MLLQERRRELIYRRGILYSVRYSITEVPHQSTLRTKTRLDTSIKNYKMRDIYTKSIRIDKAVAAIQRGEFIHFNNAADHYKCSRSAISRRMRGLTKSKKQANSF